MGTKDKIIQAAIELFAIHGYHKTTMDMIAKEAEVGKGTLYWYFSSKKDLFKGILEAGFDEYFSFLEKIKDENLSSKEKLQAIINYRLDFLQKRQPLARVIMSNKEGLDKEFKERMLERRKKDEEILTEIFIQGVNNGEFQLEDTNITTLAFTGLITSVAKANNTDLFAPKNKERTSRILMNLISRGILKQ